MNDDEPTDLRDVDQGVAALNREEASTLLVELITALHEKNIGKAYAILRVWGL